MISDTIINQAFPANIQAEQWILGAIFLDSGCIDRVANILTSDNFYKEAHKKIFSVILDLYEKSVNIDLVTLEERLEKKGILEDVGGISYLFDLANCVPSTADVEDHARIVKEKYLLRSLITAMNETLVKCYHCEKGADDLLDEAESAILKICEEKIQPGFVSIKKVIADTLDIIDHYLARQGGLTGLATGFDRIDALTSGLQASDFVVIAGRPSMGKTSFCLNIAYHVAIKQNLPVAIFSAEMTREQLAMRLLSAEARIDSRALRSGFLRQDDMEKIKTIAEAISHAEIFIDDTPVLSDIQIRARARRLHREKKIALIIIDYLQLLVTSRKPDNRQQEVSFISRSLKALAKELNIPVVVASQLSRAPEMRKDRRPMLSDLRESGAIEQDGDLIIFIHRPEYYNILQDEEGNPTEGIAEIIIGKQRNGPTDTKKLAFIKQYARFENLFEESPF